MNSFLRFLTIMAVMCLVTFFPSCSANKKITETNLHEISSNRLLKEIERSNFKFDEFQAKYTAKVETEDAKLSLKGQIRMKNDSVVWLSVSLPVGMEVVRALITTDSVFVVNRTDKTYIKESISKFKQIPSQFAEIGFVQSLLVGNNAIMSKSDKYASGVEREYYKLESSDKKILVAPTLFKIHDCTLKDEANPERIINVVYDNYDCIYDTCDDINEKIIPTQIDLSITNKPKFNISISYSNIIVNAEQDYKFSIPKKFTKAK